jgi:hypothetical protein
MRYLILSICTILVGCRFSNSGHNRFSENWYSCSKDGFYIELIIKADSFKYSANNGLVTKYCNFEFENDILIYRDLNFHEDSTVIKKATVKFISDKQMTMDFTNPVEHWTFYKLEEKISEIDNNEKLLTGTRQRAVKYKCVDSSTMEEKSKDSTKNFIYFQF